MAVRTISTSIKLDGEQEFKKQMSSVNSELKNLKSEMSLATAEFKGQANSMEALTTKGRLLQQQYDQQKAKVQALEQAVQDSADAYGEADKRTDDYRRQLNYAKTALVNLNSEIQQNEQYLDEARRSADRCASSIDEYGREVKQAAQNSSELSISSPFSGLDNVVSGLGSLKGALLGGAAAGAVVAGVQAVAGAITEVVDASAEYRKIMGTLEVSSQAAGYSAEQTAQTYKRLYSVLGDTQTAATTTANLQAIGLSQEQLMVITDSAIGAWARYGDSIPIDGLAEAINETIQAGQVTGTFADVLNWAGTNEDDFNTKLAAANSTTERANIVLQELTAQGLAQAGQAWIDTNDDIVAANESQAAFEEAQAKLGEKLSPVRDFLRDLGTAGFEFLSDAIDGVTQAIQDLGDWWDRTQPKFQSAWDKFWGIEEGTHYMMLEDGTYGWAKLDGSHAMGLNYVPFDGYVAMLHQGERVLTAQQARVMDSLFRADLRQPAGVTAGDLRQVTAAAVNAMGTMTGSQGTGPLTINLVTPDGQVFARWQLPYLRNLSKSNPEVVSDR